MMSLKDYNQAFKEYTNWAYTLYTY